MFSRGRDGGQGYQLGICKDEARNKGRRGTGGQRGWERLWSSDCQDLKTHLFIHRKMESFPVFYKANLILIPKRNNSRKKIEIILFNN